MHQSAVSEQPASQTQPRAFGRVRLTARMRGPKTVLKEFRQQGSAKALYPRTFGADLQAVLLNTAGGVTGGDDFGYQASVETEGWLTLATQTAERAYRAGMQYLVSEPAESVVDTIADWFPDTDRAA